MRSIHTLQKTIETLRRRRGEYAKCMDSKYLFPTWQHHFGNFKPKKTKKDAIFSLKNLKKRVQTGDSDDFSCFCVLLTLSRF